MADSSMPIPAEELAAVEARCEAAWQELFALCKGENRAGGHRFRMKGENRAGGHRFRMTVPCEPTDSDELIGAALKDHGRLLAGYKRLQDDNERLQGVVAGPYCSHCGSRVSVHGHDDNCPTRRALGLGNTE